MKPYPAASGQRSERSAVKCWRGRPGSGICGRWRSRGTCRLNAQLHEWRRTLAASTFNHRRHALMNLVRGLYGRRASFDLLDLLRLRPAAAQARWVDRRQIAEVLAEIPAGSVTRVRIDLMHWTGMRPAQMGRLRAEDFRLDEAIATWRSRAGRAAGSRPSRLCRKGSRPRAPSPTPKPSGRGLAAGSTGARRRRAPGRTAGVHHLADSPLVRGRRAAGRDRRGGHPGPVWTYAVGEDHDLCAAGVGQAPGCTRTAALGRRGGPEPAGRLFLAGTVGWQGHA